MFGTIVNILLIVLVLGILVTIHELGHFLAAKWMKVQVDEFSIGMGPALFSKKLGGTIYSLRILPIGGYVRILGEGDDPDTDLEALKVNPGNFQTKHPLKKIFILSAGVLMNLLTAVIIYYGFLIAGDFKAGALDVENYQPWFGTLETEMYGDVDYTLAEEGGAREGGWPEEGFIISVSDVGAHKMYPVVLSSDYTDFVSTRAGDDVSTGICEDIDDSDTCDVYVSSVSDEGKVGIFLPQNYLKIIAYEGWEKFASGFLHSANVIQMSFVQMSTVFSDASSNGDYDTAINTVSSPIGLYFIVDFLKAFGVLGILDLIANLSLVLFIMNLLPIPALDGGRIVMVLTEWVLGDKYSKTVEAWAIRISFIILMVFMLLIVVKDIFYFDTLRELFG